MVEVGSWKSFYYIEEHLILDELLLLTEQLAKKRRHEMRMIAMSQGVDIDEGETDGDGFVVNTDDLPPEVLEAERRFKEEREAKRKAKLEAGEPQQFAEGLGYEVVS